MAKTIKVSTKAKPIRKPYSWARWPSVDPGKKSRVTLGGINLGIGEFSENRGLAQEAALCLAQPDNQVIASARRMLRRVH